MFALYNPLD